MNAESSLIERSRAGDSEAFGCLVGQYQSLVCAVTYSLCGDVSRSEELAQETFVTAWKQLGKLEEPRKFKAWLCGIARNLTRSAFRSAQRDASSKAASLEEASAIPTPEPEPDAEAMMEDESALVWNALSQLPENYREPLVLFYREEQNVQHVAESLELSEDAVKQRLSRGRGMLRERVAAIVEGALTRTRPGPAFTIAVLASLPAMLPPTASAAVVVGSAAAKGTGTAGSTAAAGTLGAVVGPLIGCLGGWLGVRAALKGTKTKEERQAVKRMSWQMVGFILFFVIVMLALMMLGPRYFPGRAFVLSIVGVSAAYVIALGAMIIFANRKFHRLRDAGMTPEERSPKVAAKRAFRFRSKGSLLGLPLIHINTGTVVEGKYKRATAKGWLAFGDVAISPFLAMGSVAFGSIAFGAIPIGLVAMGGLAIGLLGFGGMAIGYLAVGGCGIGWWAAGGAALGYEAALGGAALAKDYALGGAAFAAEANTQVAQAYFSEHAVWAPVNLLLEHSRWFIGLAFLPFVLAPLYRVFGRFLPAETEGVRLTSGWIVECPKCGFAKPLAESGGVRIGASSYQKRVLGFCLKCRRLRWVAIRKLDS